ncbi:LysR family transcriptional regulator [Ralstonia chuxiongensis]|uniref:LysR family transcriptional regulator n=1 Tax=Ralstonia chuxiongensis TaxID=2957504 RepID=UPI0028F511C6|nr:LysR family transcriptional regulator [Ralstonia chuxiongensis]CAJ0785401.1 HTH-type transcriptional regulator DmlR [Ralstonia chuxiongensis]
MDRLDAMRLFCQIVDAGGFAKAAKVLGMSPTAVTQGLARLERYYGTRLLDRTTRRMSVTEAGRILYERARHLLDETVATEDAVRGATCTPQGNLRVTLPLGVAMTFIYRRLSEFAAQYPDISLDLQVSDRIVDLVAGNFDIGLRAGILADAEVVAYSLCRYRRLTCASPNYLAQHGVPRHPSDLPAFACLSYRHDALAVTWDFLVDGQRQSYGIQSSYASNESYALLAMTRAGMGISRQPDWLVEDDLRTGRLVTVLDDFALPIGHDAPGIYAITPRQRYRTAKVEAFLAFARESVGEAQPTSQ